jgi:hypothetical protein
MSISSTSLYLIPSPNSVTVNTNLIADSRESLINTQNTASFYSTLTQATVVSSSPTVYTNLIADSGEGTVSNTTRTAYTSTIKEVTVVSPGINVSTTPITASAVVADSLNKVQIWTIS